MTIDTRPDLCAQEVNKALSVGETVYTRRYERVPAPSFLAIHDIVKVGNAQYLLLSDPEWNAVEVLQDGQGQFYTVGSRVKMRRADFIRHHVEEAVYRHAY